MLEQRFTSLGAVLRGAGGAPVIAWKWLKSGTPGRALSPIRVNFRDPSSPMSAGEICCDEHLLRSSAHGKAASTQID